MSECVASVIMREVNPSNERQSRERLCDNCHTIVCEFDFVRLNTELHGSYFDVGTGQLRDDSATSER